VEGAGWDGDSIGVGKGAGLIPEAKIGCRGCEGFVRVVEVVCTFGDVAVFFMLRGIRSPR